MIAFPPTQGETTHVVQDNCPDYSVSVVTLSQCEVACIMGRGHDLVPKTTQKGCTGGVPAPSKKDEHQGKKDSTSESFCSICLVIVTIIQTFGFQPGDQESKLGHYLILFFRINIKNQVRLSIQAIFVTNTLVWVIRMKPFALDWWQ